MLRKVFIQFGKKKNPDFDLDPQVGSMLLLSFVFSKLASFARGWKLLFYGKVPKLLFLGRKVRFLNVKNMEIGRFVQIHEYVYLCALGKGKLSLGNNVTIGAFSSIAISKTFHDLGAHITIGDNVGLGEYAHLGGAGGLEIGENTIVGPYLSCHPENHFFQDPDVPIRFQGLSREGIKIGKNCWIGAKVTVLDGVTIGDNCVLAAGAVITKSMPANTVIGGVPAKVLKYIQPEDRPQTQAEMVHA